MRVIAFFICTAALYAQTDWPVYGGNLGNTRYSALNQIDTTNVAKLAQAWIFDTKPSTAAKANRQIEVTPLVVNGVMYLVTAYQSLVALDPDTGQQIWESTPIETVQLIGLARDRLIFTSLTPRPCRAAPGAAVLPESSGEVRDRASRPGQNGRAARSPSARARSWHRPGDRPAAGSRDRAMAWVS